MADGYPKGMDGDWAGRELSSLCLSLVDPRARGLLCKHRPHLCRVHAGCRTHAPVSRDRSVNHSRPPAPGFGQL
jgi:hypothetical protein